MNSFEAPKPILNSLFTEPAKHWNIEEGQASHRQPAACVRVGISGACPAHERLADGAERWTYEIRLAANDRRPRACLGFRTPSEVFHEKNPPTGCD